MAQYAPHVINTRTGNVYGYTASLARKPGYRMATDEDIDKCLRRSLTNHRELQLIKEDKENKHRASEAYKEKFEAAVNLVKETLKDMTKKELVEHASEKFGLTLEDSLRKNKLIAQVLSCYEKEVQIED